jgi:hypothetical protein
MRPLVVVTLLGLLVAGCGPTQLPMPYSPVIAPRPQANARPVVMVGQVVDDRQGGREDAHWIGTIRSGYGTPVRTLEAPIPVREVVAQAFRDALATRGLLTTESGAAYELRVVIAEYSANQYVRWEATADFRVSLINRSTGTQVWSGRARSNPVGGNPIGFTGVFDSVDNLRGIALRAMADTIDQLLDRPDFAAALR